LHSARRNAPMRTSFTILLPLVAHADAWDPMVNTGTLVYVYRQLNDANEASTSHSDSSTVYGAYHVPPICEPCDPKQDDEPLYCTFTLSTPSGKDMFSLFDSGATSSYIARDAVSRLQIPKELLLESTPQTIETITGSTVTSQDMTVVQFVCHGLRFTVYAGVLDSFPSGLDLIIGQDFMQFYQVSLHFQHNGFLQLQHDATSQRINLDRPYL
jgi:hypothetical protein